MADRFDRFTPELRAALIAAEGEARGLHHGYIGTEHLLLALVADPTSEVALALDGIGVSEPNLREAVGRVEDLGPPEAGAEIGMTPEAKEVIKRAVNEARRCNDRQVGVKHLVLGLALVEDRQFFNVLYSMGISREQAIEALVTPLWGAPSNLIRVQLPPIHSDSGGKPFWRRLLRD